MKKFSCLLLCCLMLLPLFSSCKKECEHAFVDGVCKKCDVACEHDFKNGVCTVCDMPCAHQFTDGVCSVCGHVCVHSYEKGICKDCGAKNLTKEDLVGRYFKYAYFEVEWSANATERDKEILRKKYNVVDDEQLFDEIHDTLTEFLELANVLGGVFGGEEQGYYFKRYDVRSSPSDEYTGDEYVVKDNTIMISDKTFYYEKDRIYTIGDSQDFKGIAIKTVFAEELS